MKDYRVMFPGVEPIIGWTITNYRDRSKNGEVQQMQGFKGYTLDGKPLPKGYYDQDMIAVPEGQFHTSPQFFIPTPEQAIEWAAKDVERCLADANRIMASIERVTGCL